MSAATTASAYHPSRARSWTDAIMTWPLRRGRGPGFLRLLTVTGRISGQPRTIPVAPVQRDGQVWIVAPYGAAYNLFDVPD